MALLLLAFLIAAAHAVSAIHNPMMNSDLFEGDILGIPTDADRSAIPRDSQRWPKGIIPYEIDGNLKRHRQLIRQSMDHIESHTCIKFVPRTDQNDYILITYSIGCNSHWGRAGDEQRVSLGNGCHNKGTVVHELLHAVGFMHEHNRPDRDDYLTIYYENIPENWHFAFKKLLPSQTRMLTPFDYDSIMLYGNTAFSKSYTLKSMEAKDGRPLIPAFIKPGMSAGDIKRVNILYQCQSKQ